MRPDRVYATSHAHDRQVVVVGEQTPDPIGRRYGVVVEKGNDVPSRGFHAGIARTRQALPMAVGKPPNARKFCCHIGQQIGIVVDDRDDLMRALLLVENRGQRLAQQGQALG